MLRVFCCVFFILSLFGCSDKQSEKNNVFTVKQSVYIPKISYNGVIRPACYKIIVSPADGHVAKIIIPFGEKITKGLDLIELNDSQINKDYIADIVGFLENKEKLRKAKMKLKAEKELYSAGVVSKNELDDDQYNYDAAYIALLRSEFSLQKKSTLLGLDFKGVGNLTLHDMHGISKSISRDFSIHIKSTADGRWMSPLLIDQKSKSDVGNIYIGKKVEKGEVVGVIIDDSCGLKVKLYATHEQINLIKKDMKVTVHSKMFSGFNVLNGNVNNVSYFDVKVDDNDETKLLFPVEIIIPKIPETLKSIALLGMKVQVFFKLKAEHQIRIPIKAVKAKNNDFFVTKIAKNGSKKDVLIKIGVANIKDVEVQSGLKVGDKVVLYD